MHDLDIPETAREAPLVDDGVARWHGWADPIRETSAVLRALNIEPTYIDINPSRQAEAVVDLNMPLPEEYRGQFDAVLDAGTTEHCFNVGQAFRNVASALKLGGFAIHCNPMSCLNHGFWNFNPTAMVDFYEANGFAIERLAVLLGPISRRAEADILAMGTKRLAFTRDMAEANLLCVAQKGRVVEPRWPHQTKYKLHPSLAA